MILEQHYDDAVLIAFLGDEPAARRDPHLITCRPCAETLATLRTMAEALEDETVWELRELDDTPRQSTIDTLRAKQREMAGEDAAAAPRLKQLLAQPREMWAGMIEAHPEWRTAGMVRAMVGEHPSLIRTSPADGLELMTLAVAVAGDLPSYDRVSRAHARRELAYAFYFQGRLDEATAQLNIAEELAATLRSGDYDMARQRVIRSLIARGLDDGEAAIAYSRQAAAVFADYGDALRYHMAESARAAVLIRAGRLREGVELLQHIESQIKDPATRFGTIQNIGVAYAHMGEFDKAFEFLRQAVTFVTYSGAATETARMRLTIGGILMQKKRFDEALDTLRNAEAEFIRLGMSEEAVLAGLSQAELFLALGKNSDAAAICRRIYDELRLAGLDKTQRAVVAVAFLHEAVERGRAKPETARRVRRRVQAVRFESVLFAPR